MRDGGMVAGIVAGDPAALAAAYDHYAPALYAYSRSLLSDPAAAAEAVQSTFVVAALRLAGLRDPSRLRPWLYAVARNECRRQLDGDGAAAPPEPGEAATGEDTTDFGDALEQAELRELVWAALAGLSSADREIVELSLRHEFYGADLADALGVPRNQAHALTSRGRAAFETALGALLVTRSGQGSCADLAEILSSWDGELTTAIRKQVRRHVDTCPSCGGQRRRELSPVALLSHAAGPGAAGRPAQPGIRPDHGRVAGGRRHLHGHRGAGRAVHPVRVPGAAGPGHAGTRAGHADARRRGAGGRVRAVRRGSRAGGEHAAP